jgi:hypothetical protein
LIQARCFQRRVITRSCAALRIGSFGFRGMGNDNAA